MSINARIQKRLQDLNMSPRAASLEAGFSTHFIHALLTGKKRSISADALIPLAKVLECSPEWLLTGVDPETGSREVPILSYVGGGAVVHPVNDYSNTVQVTGDVPEGAFALIVRGDSMYPLYGDGDVLVCVAVGDPIMLLNADAVVDLADGRRMVKNLRPGVRSGTFELGSLGDPPIRDAVVLRAAKIVMVRKG